LPAFGAPQLRVVRLAPTARLRLRQAPVLRAELRIGLGGLHAQNHPSGSSALSGAGARSRSLSSRPSAAVASDRAPAGPPLRGGSGARGARSDSRSPLNAPRSIGARWGAVGRGAAPRSSGARGGAGGAVRFSTGSSSRNARTGRYWCPLLVASLATYPSSTRHSRASRIVSVLPCTPRCTPPPDAHGMSSTNLLTCFM